MKINFVQGQKQKFYKAAVWPGVLLAPSGTMFPPLRIRHQIRYMHIKIPKLSPEAIRVLQALSSDRLGFVRLRHLRIIVDNTGGTLGDPSVLYLKLESIATMAFWTRSLRVDFYHNPWGTYQTEAVRTGRIEIEPDPLETALLKKLYIATKGEEGAKFPCRETRYYSDWDESTGVETREYVREWPEVDMTCRYRRTIWQVFGS
jgi:hypothetical protein